MRKWRPAKVPTNAHPLVRGLFVEMARQRIGLMDMADRSGVNRGTLKNWRTKNVPTVDKLIACYNVLGMDLTVAKRREP